MKKASNYGQRFCQFHHLKECYPHSSHLFTFHPHNFGIIYKYLDYIFITLTFRTFLFAVPGSWRDSPRGSADKMTLGMIEMGRCWNEQQLCLFGIGTGKRSYIFKNEVFLLSTRKRPNLAAQPATQVFSQNRTNSSRLRLTLGKKIK